MIQGLAGKDTTRMMDGGEQRAYVTLITSDSYLPGVQVLLHSLKLTRTRVPVVCMVTERVGEAVRRKIASCGAEVLLVESIQSPLVRENEGGHVKSWMEVGLTKLRLWGLTRYDCVVYLDADCMIVENIDELFDRKVDFAAAPDVFPPDRFNAGVMVVRPNAAVLEDMLSKLVESHSYDGGDTGMLNCYFSSWFASDAAHRLPFGYNAQRTLHWMTHEKNPGYWNAVTPLKVLHYCSSPKPWEEVGRKGDLEMLWWQTFIAMQMQF